MNDILKAALTWHALGYSVIPVAADGSKRPAVPWKQYQTQRADTATIRNWFADGRYGLGIITGAVSGNAEMAEFEGRAVAEGYVEKMRAAMEKEGLAQLWARLGGYVEHTPGGGLHLYYRVDGPARPNTKLARRPATPEELAEHPQVHIMVLMETRGEGGFVVVAPTPAEFHTTGKPWSVLRGYPADIPTITVEERDLLHAVANSLDALPATEPAPAPTTAPRILPNSSSGHSALADAIAGRSYSDNGGIRPGDDYNNRADWTEILTDWKRMRPIGSGWGWQRPGKSGPSISATTGTAADGVDRLYVFSTSTQFDSEKPYSKFAAYTHLHHGGDYSAAGKSLVKLGYGERPPAATSTAVRSQVAIDTDTAANTAATATATATTTAEPAAPVADLNGYNRRTDAANAAELVKAYGEKLRFDCDRNRWLVFKNHHWELQPPGGGEVRELAKDTAHRMVTTDSKDVTWQHKSLSTAGVTACLGAAETIPGIMVHTNEFDANPYLLGTPGGVVDLMTGELRDGRPEDMVSRSTTVTPDFGPTPKIWTDFLTTTFSGDEATIRYIQQLFGLALIGEVTEHILPLFYGELGFNGKSTLVDTALHILGISDRGYATSIPSETLMVRKHEAHSTELAVMAGRRLIVASELEDGQRLAEARVKLITGNDVISARFLYGQPFSFKPSHLVLMVGNNKPKATTGGPALWRRLRSVPFLHQMPVAERDLKLGDKLLACYGGHILAWMVGGAIDFRTNGLQTPPAVLEATEQYQREEDSVGRFVDDRIHVGGAGSPARLAVRDFRRAYEEWCQENGEIPVSPRRITQELGNRFDVQSVKGAAGARFYTRLTLYAEEGGTSGSTSDNRFDRSWDN